MISLRLRWKVNTIKKRKVYLNMHLNMYSIAVSVVQNTRILTSLTCEFLNDTMYSSSMIGYIAMAKYYGCRSVISIK